jgi:transposase
VTKPGSSVSPPGRVKNRARTVTARDQERVLNEIAQAKRRLGLPETASVVSCYEAGRDGFWLHRCLEAHGITNHVMDSSAIEVSRCQRRAKSDGLDVRKLLIALWRFLETGVLPEGAVLKEG